MIAIDETAQRWRDALMSSVGPAAGFPLLLSGGTDSATLLAALLAIGRPPPLVIAYALRGEPSDDLGVAASMASEFSIPFRSVWLSTDVEDHRDRVRAVAKLALLSVPVRATHVMCCVPTAAMLDGLETPVVVGTGGIVEDNRLSQMIAFYGAKAGEHSRKVSFETDREASEYLAALRRRNLLGVSDSATWAMKRLGDAMGCPLVEAYSSEPVAETGLAIPYCEINRRPGRDGSRVRGNVRGKGIALRAFPEFWRRGPWYRSLNVSLQLGSGLRTFYIQTARGLGFTSRAAGGVGCATDMFNSWLNETSR